MTRNAHRALGVALALPLVLWMATGLLFHVKHRYAEAYEALKAPAPPADLARFTVSAAQAAATGVFETGCVPRFAVRPDGKGAWFGKKGDAGAAVDAERGSLLEPAEEGISSEWGLAAVRASAHASRYGTLVRAVPSRTPASSPLTHSKNLSLDLVFSGGKTVTVDRLTGEVSQTGALNDWIDLTYRVHYLQWTPWKAANVALVLAAIPLVLALAASGVRLFTRR
jgi:hypothetical protein